VHTEVFFCDAQSACCEGSFERCWNRRAAVQLCYSEFVGLLLADDRLAVTPRIKKILLRRNPANSNRCVDQFSRSAVGGK
jgi:hypothetical protein